MWNNDDGDELNEEGRPVQLYLPVSTGNSSGFVGPNSGGGGGTSYIGGQWTPPPVAEDDDQQHLNLLHPVCDNCNESLWLLVQFDVPPQSQQQQQPQCLRKTISVFGCPKQDCFSCIKFNNGFSNGGQGVLKCIQHQSKPATSDTVRVNAKSNTPSAPAKSSWYDNDDDDDWGLDNSKNNAAVQQSLEDAVAAMEMGLDEHGSISMTKSKKNKNSHSKQKQTTEDKNKNKNKNNNNNKTTNSFKCFRLKAQDEPMSSRPVLEDDDVGLSESDEKIRNMLARYMAEEDDEEILAALRGANNGGGASAGGAGGGEEDERLTDEERILRGFQDRLRREPTQVLRRAKPNGTPLWSLIDKDRRSGKTLWSVPDCKACGWKLSFEFQLLPSILSTLEVDKYASCSSSTAATRNKKSPDDEENEDNAFDLDELLTTGMNFGSVAVFACDNADCPSSKKQSGISDDVFLVIQESADEGTALRESRKKKKQRNNAHNQQLQQQQEGSSTRTTQMRELPQATMAIVEDLDDDDQFELDG